MTTALIGFAILIALSLTGIPLAFATLLVGFVGFWFVRDWDSAVAMSGQQIAEMITNPNLVVVPIFVLMGEFIRRGRIADELYEFGNAVVGWLRGGVAMSTVLACGAFSAVCGSSIATAATMTKVAMPPMRSYGYRDSLSAGTIAAGGTLGILIPPSIPMVIYCIFAREDIGLMFIAGIVPGALMMLAFIITISIWVRFDPKIAPSSSSMDWAQRTAAIKKTWAFVALFSVVLGGIYLGVFTPTEAASVGAIGAWLFAVARGTMRTLRDYLEVMGGAVGISASIFAIASCALVFTQFVTITGLPYALLDLVTSWGLHDVILVLAIGALCILLGMVFEVLGILVLIVPMFLPTLEAQGIDLIWFGVLVIILVELGLITPPVGVNVFTVKAAQPDLKLTHIFIGVGPFAIAMLVTAALIVAFPQIATGLPNLMR
ncbi:TRAP transporter large permease [Betaproteobacteria bacterium LSUCC0117]|nr:TRAP transporter large permease [Betaproteobacteria bacterium LSUCC0117]